ncbi:hypothetical protein [Lactiplantibacillus plantarum]|nr:hypothetical protein [Lactiplantibacillus plantarum]
MRIPDYIWMPAVTWLISALWFNRRNAFGVDEEDFKHGKQRNS